MCRRTGLATPGCRMAVSFFVMILVTFCYLKGLETTNSSKSSMQRRDGSLSMLFIPTRSVSQMELRQVTQSQALLKDLDSSQLESKVKSEFSTNLTQMLVNPINELKEMISPLEVNQSVRTRACTKISNITRFKIWPCLQEKTKSFSPLMLTRSSKSLLTWRDLQKSKSMSI